VADHGGRSRHVSTAMLYGRVVEHVNCPCQLDDARPRPGDGALARSPVRRRPEGPRENTNMSVPEFQAILQRLVGVR
jgi:hypothetical protein